MTVRNLSLLFCRFESVASEPANVGGNVPSRSISETQGPTYPRTPVRRVSAILGPAVFLVIAPGFVAGLVPWWISRWRVEAPLLGMSFLRFVGGVLITLGLVALLDSFVRFAVQGVGTPASVFPTRHLEISGLYRHVRNPMYVAVVMTIFGQGVLLGNVRLLEYGGLVWFLFHSFVLLYDGTSGKFWI